MINEFPLNEMPFIENKKFNDKESLLKMHKDVRKI